ncbi:MAG: hypothetical protein C0186_02445, partial [Thermodesulfovibrio aggregans]
ISDFTHEINNHLALIKESAGLISDICKGKKSIDKKEMPYVIESLQAIENQIHKSVSFINYLNRFAHRMDNLQASFNLNSVIEELCELLKRYSNSKKISIQYTVASDLPDINNSPFIVQFAIFYAIDSFLKRSKPDTVVSIKARAEDNSLKIIVKYEGDFVEKPSQQIWTVATIQEVVAITDIKISATDKVIIIEIPA